MAVQPEGTPCWADAAFGDVDAAKSFYASVLGWTFGEPAGEYGNYTQAYADGKPVAGIMPLPPGQTQPAWGLYLATPDVEATVAKIREHGGQTLTEPMRVGDMGTMLLATDPAGVVFGAWQADTFEGFQAKGVPGAYCWAEVFTRDPEKSDPFFADVFSYRKRTMRDDAVDFLMFDVGDETVLGRMRMGDDFPPEVPSYINVYFTVEDCDAAVAKATELGAVPRFGPMSMPFGRFAALTDPEGAAFSLIDITTTEGEVPKTAQVP